MTKMTKFRWHRGGYKESMETVVPAETWDDLFKIVTPKVTAISGNITLRVDPYTYDNRNNWDTHIVTLNGDAIGFTDGIPK